MYDGRRFAVDIHGVPDAVLVSHRHILFPREVAAARSGNGIIRLDGERDIRRAEAAARAGFNVRRYYAGGEPR